MSLPAGWQVRTLGEVAHSVRNGLFVSRPTDTPPGVAMLRISAVREGRVDLTGARFVDGLDAAAIAKFSIDPGDLLMTRYNGSRRLVGISGIVGPHVGPVLHPDKLIRVRVDAAVADSAFVNYQLAGPAARAFLEPRIRTTAGQSGISGVDVKAVPLNLPSLEEQRRIVEILEDHLSRLDAANALLTSVRERCSPLVSSLLQQAVPMDGSSGWKMVTVAEAGRLDLGRQRHPDWHHGPEMRAYLRVANVFEDRIDTSDVMQMDFSGGAFERFRLEPGDLLLNEGQSPHLLGRPAIYRGQPPEVAFTNSLLRFRAREDVLPEWALLVFRRHMRSGRFMRESRITTNIAHLSAGRLKGVEFPIPPVAEQRRILADVEAKLTLIQASERAAAAAVDRGRALRRALLAAAFGGGLTASVDANVIERMAGV